jgi:hypothetical protein
VTKNIYFIKLIIYFKLFSILKYITMDNYDKHKFFIIILINQLQQSVYIPVSDVSVHVHVPVVDVSVPAEQQAEQPAEQQAEQQAEQPAEAQI